MLLSAETRTAISLSLPSERAFVDLSRGPFPCQGKGAVIESGCAFEVPNMGIQCLAHLEYEAFPSLAHMGIVMEATIASVA